VLLLSEGTGVVVKRLLPAVGPEMSLTERSVLEMGQDDDEVEKKKALWRAMSPEYRMFELVEKLNARLEAHEEESRQRTEQVRLFSEETQRKIEFIVGQQAQFTADMQQLRESQANSERRWERTEGSVRALLEIAQSHEDEINALREAQASLTEAQTQTNRQMAETDRRMAETDERINTLVNFVERLVGERHNGGSDA
jgi:hypothetical protein